MAPWYGYDIDCRLGGAVTWLRVDDGLDNDPRIIAVARNRADADRVLGIMVSLMLYAARHLTDGYLPALIVAEHVPRPLLGRLIEVGLLHTGPGCECLRGRAWPPDAAYAVHHYLQSNPTRAEVDVARAKAAELRDRELLLAVRARDGDTCRYCGVAVGAHDRRSAHGLVYDHVNPAVAAGAANIVVACRSCNSRKGKRTPEAAGMILRPEPRADQSPTNQSGVDLTTVPTRDGTGRSSAHPDPYLRSAITGLDPDHHAGLPIADDYPSAI